MSSATLLTVEVRRATVEMLRRIEVGTTVTIMRLDVMLICYIYARSWLLGIGFMHAALRRSVLPCLLRHDLLASINKHAMQYFIAAAAATAG